MRFVELFRRAGLWLHRDRATRELEEEMRLHREMREESLRAIGATDARVTARVQFGNPLILQERSRDMWGFGTLDDVRQDARYAARRLIQRRAFSLAVIAVLGLGIGATTAMFSAVDAAMLRPLPFAQPDQLVTLPRVAVPFDPGPGQPRRVFANHMTDVSDVAAMNGVFSHVGAWASGGVNLSAPARPRRLNAGVVTADFFGTLGVSPMLGRVFSADEGRPGNTHVAILSHELSQEQFGGRTMLGETILLNNRPYVVIGVMPPHFSFPKQSDVWIPMSIPVTFESFEPFRGWLPSSVIARIAPGVTHAAAGSQLLARWKLGIARDSAGAAETNLPEVVSELGQTGTIIPLQQSLNGERRTALYVLLGATTLLLLIACANVTNLLLSQGVARRREMAVREALGATRRRVIRQLLTESILLALGGALLGLVIAPMSLGLLRNLMPTDLAGVATAQLDVRVLAFGTMLGLVTGVGFGIWPALRSTTENLGDIIKSGSGHGGSARDSTRARRVLVAVELALTIVLMIGAGLMLRSFREVMQLDRGLDNARVGTLEMAFPASPDAPRERLQLITRLLQRLNTTPGIAATGVVNSLPLGGGGGLLLSITPDGVDLPPDENRYGPLQLFASAGYFEALGIPLIAGRSLAPTDDAHAPAVAVINEEMARLYWPGLNPLGRTFHNGPTVVTVVGIVRDVHTTQLERELLPQMYLSIYADVPANVALVARGSMSPGVLLAAMQRAVGAVDPSQATYHLRTMDQVVNSSVAVRRTNTLLISLFGGLALLLASLGVYAVVAHGVAQRSRELGIRAALGATGRELLSLMAREMVATAVSGIAAGLLLAWVLARFAETMLFGVTGHDLMTFVAVPAALLVPAAIATLVPARRAARVNPADVMRLE